MNRLWIVVLLLCSSPSISGAISADSTAKVEIRPIDSEKRIEIWIGGSLFTAYQYGPIFKSKTVFYPIRSAEGQMINRELRFIRESGETTDHPHQQSLFLGYGDINNLDFWSSAHGEKIVHKSVIGHSSEAPAYLEVTADWQTADSKVVAAEHRKVRFGGGEDVRWMDHSIELKAVSGPLVFEDTKEGMFAIRLADALREKGGSGHYINAFGQETSPVIWGKRAPWVALWGKLGNEEMTVAIFEHPTSENYPSYWHARDYGLFAINPFGRKDFIAGSTPLDLKLNEGESFHFRYKVLIYRGKVTKDRLDEDYARYMD